MNKLLVTLAFFMLFSNGVAVAASEIDWDEIKDIKTTEPTQCYEGAMIIFEGLGLGNGQMGMALRLCGGAEDATMVIGCLLKSIASVEEGGLGVPLGLAIKFCKQNG